MSVRERYDQNCILEENDSDSYVQEEGQGAGITEKGFSQNRGTFFSFFFGKGQCLGTPTAE